MRRERFDHRKGGEQCDSYWGALLHSTDKIRGDHAQLLLGLFLSANPLLRSDIDIKRLDGKRRLQYANYSVEPATITTLLKNSISCRVTRSTTATPLALPVFSSTVM